MSDRRDKLLAGITSLNRREFDARKDSEEASTEIGALVAGNADQRDAGVTSDPGDSVPADTQNQPGVEDGLEALLRAQITCRYASRDALELEAADHESSLATCSRMLEAVDRDIYIIRSILEKEYGNERGGSPSDYAVPEEGQGTTTETKENG